MTEWNDETISHYRHEFRHGNEFSLEKCQDVLGEIERLRSELGRAVKIDEQQTREYAEDQQTITNLRDLAGKLVDDAQYWNEKYWADGDATEVDLVMDESHRSLMAKSKEVL